VSRDKSEEQPGELGAALLSTLERTTKMLRGRRRLNTMTMSAPRMMPANGTAQHINTGSIAVAGHSPFGVTVNRQVYPGHLAREYQTYMGNLGGAFAGREYQTYMGNLGGESAGREYQTYMGNLGGGREYQTYVGNLSGSGGC
jgi:hypothetical protein